MEVLKRHLAVILGLIGLGLVLTYLCWRIVQHERSRIVRLPEDSEVESVTAELFDIQGLTNGAIPEFTIPEKYVPPILNALRPVEARDYPSAWDKQPLGKLLIKTRDGRTISVTFTSAGDNALCYQVDGVQCSRSGMYEPVLDIVLESGGRVGYADEGNLLAHVILLIWEEKTKGVKSSMLATRLGDLERSAGKRPPR